MPTFISFKHDNQQFFYSPEAVKAATDISDVNHGIIGFYFDHSNLPQSIHIHSIYGKYVVENYLKLKE